MTGNPSNLLELLARAVLPSGTRGETMLGDLRQEYAAGRSAAWYLGQVMSLLFGYTLPNIFRRPGLDPEGPGVEQGDAMSGSFGGDPLGSVRRDIRVGLRSLARRPAVSTVIVLTLALAIGATTTVFSLVDYLLMRPLPVSQQDRLFRAYTSDYSSGPIGGTSYPDFESFRSEVAGLDQLAAYEGRTQVRLTHGGGDIQIAANLVSGDYFNVLGVRPAVGRLISPVDAAVGNAQGVAVLAHETWRTVFGQDSSLIGRSIIINGTPVAVIGIAAQRFDDIDVGSAPDIWLPLEFSPQLIAGVRHDDFTERGARWLFMVGRMADGVSLEQLDVQFNSVMGRLAREYPESNLGTRDAPDQARPVTVLPLADAFGQRSDIASRGGFLLAVVGLVLLLAAANVANVLVAQGQQRRREFAVRLALGAQRGRLFRQLMVESMLLSLLGGTAGLVLAAVLGRTLIPLGLPSVLASWLTLESVPFDWRVGGFALALSTITGLVFGLLPAAGAGRQDLVPALKEGERQVPVGGRARLNLRDGLVMFQVALSLVVVSGASLFVGGWLQASKTELGFNHEGVALTRVSPSGGQLAPEQGAVFYRDILQQAATLPGVSAVSLSRYMPVQGGGMRRGFMIQGFEDAGAVAPNVVFSDNGFAEFNLNVVSRDYFTTLEIPLLRGRTFDEGDTDGTLPVAVVNQVFADLFWPNGNAVGQLIGTGIDSAPGYRIVGVVANGKYRDIAESPLPYIYLPLSQNYSGGMWLAARSAGSADALVAELQSVAASLSPQVPVSAGRTLEDHVSRALAQERTTSTLLVVLGSLALVVATVGFYGMLAFSVARRRQEIGVRTALGASPATLVKLVLSHGLRVMVPGAVVGAGAAWVLGRVMASTVNGVPPLNPAVLGIAVGVLTVAALLASAVPARRAVRLDPVSALRAE